MTLIELVRSIDGAEQALAMEGLEYNRRWETGWKWSRRPITEGMARTVIHGLAGNLLSAMNMQAFGSYRGHQWSDGSYTRSHSYALRASTASTVERWPNYTAYCLGLIVAAGKEKK